MNKVRNEDLRPLIDSAFSNDEMYIIINEKKIGPFFISRVDRTFQEKCDIHMTCYMNKEEPKPLIPPPKPEPPMDRFVQEDKEPTQPCFKPQRAFSKAGNP